MFTDIKTGVTEVYYFGCTEGDGSYFGYRKIDGEE